MEGGFVVSSQPVSVSSYHVRIRVHLMDSPLINWRVIGTAYGAAAGPTQRLLARRWALGDGGQTVNHESRLVLGSPG